MKVVYWIVFAISLMALLAAIAYCRRNESGHSSEDPLHLIPLFAPVFTFGLVGRLLGKGRWLSAGLVEVTGFVGMAFGIFVSKLGILNQHEDWIAAGMPERNPCDQLLLVGFTLGALGGSLAVAFMMAKEARSENADAL